MKPKIKKCIILRYIPPESPLVYNRTTNELFLCQETQYKFLSLCNGDKIIEDIVHILEISNEDALKFIKNMKRRRILE